MSRRRYSRLWYMKRRKMNSLRILLCFSVVILALISLWNLVDITLFPNAQKGFETSLKEYSYKQTEQVLTQTLGENISMSKLVDIQRDSKGTITAIRTDTVALSKLTDRIEQALKADLIDNKTQNRRLFYTGELPYDPLVIYLGMVRMNNLSVKYDSIFTPDPVKGTRHKIDLTYEISYSTLKGSNEMEYSYVIWDNLMPEVTLK